MADLKQHTSSAETDPTYLTTQNLLREVEHVKELMFTRIGCVEEIVHRVEAAAGEMPEARTKDIHHVKELLLEQFETTNEKFRSIQTQFQERDTRSEQTGRDSKVAIDAALSAQEKAVGKQTDSFTLSINKSEAATAKSIDQLGEMVNSNFKALDEKINDVKDRMTRVEGLGVGKLAETQERHASNFNAANIVGMIAGGLGLLIAAVTIIVHVPK